MGRLAAVTILIQGEPSFLTVRMVCFGFRAIEYSKRVLEAMNVFAS